MFKEIYERLRMDSPRLFVQLQNFFISLLITAGTTATAIKILPATEMPAWIDPEYVKTGIIMGVIGLALSKLVVKDGEELARRLEK
jgi:hypothetical protein